VGPIADGPYLQRVAATHQLHHADKFNGVPYGFFLGPKEVEMVGGVEELDKLVKARAKTSNYPTDSANTS
jgi:beta-carotene 3-hydroxylase